MRKHVLFTIVDGVVVVDDIDELVFAISYRYIMKKVN
jgi:hypothetical protein